jgi:hypothetical protein
MKMRCFLLTTLFLIFAGSANAQHWTDPKLTTKVPFDFVVSGTTLPAGTYVVRTYFTGRTLMVQNRENPEFVVIVNNTNIVLSAGKTANSSGFVFALVNGQHVLHQIRIENDTHTHDIIHGNGVAELVAKR